jgi:hypothetical protein
VILCNDVKSAVPHHTPSRAGDLTVSLQDGFEIAVFVGWAGCILGLISVTRHSSSEFQSIGRSKSRWFWINALGFVPYLGIITALSYFLRVSLSFPEKPRTATGAGPRSSSQSQQPTDQSTRGRRTSSPSTPPRMPKPNCTRCNGSGRVMDTFCNGSGQQVVNGEVVPHFTCSGSGRVQCDGCGGSGKQR